MSRKQRQITVVLADDHVLVRNGIRGLLEKLDGVKVVGEASDGREALQLIASLKPAIAIIDIGMPNLNGLEAAARISTEFPETKVLILSMHANKQYVARALSNGISGYLLKDAAGGELELALTTIRAGQIYLSSALSQTAVQSFIRETERSGKNVLTSRQREILQLLAEGKNSKEIAALLELSPKTVEAHRSQIMERLDIRDVAGLVRYAIQQGFSTLESS